jgi:hypothetical protein
VFDEVTLNGTTDKEGRATIAPPEDGPAEFKLFLVSCPEKYSDDSEKVTASRAVAQNTNGTQGLWPLSVLATLLLALLGLGIGSVAKGQTGGLGKVKAVLNGPMYQGSATEQVEMEITLDEEKAAGRVKYGDDEFTMLKPRVEVLAALSGGGEKKARYRLRYQTNLCEHAEAKPKGTVLTKWDACFYTQGQARPDVWLDAEVLMNRQQVGGHDVMVAIGVPDVRSLYEVFRVTGSVAR